MEVDWSVEAGAADAVVEIPWSDPSGMVAYVDLHASTGGLDEGLDAIAEVKRWPELRAALKQMNERPAWMQTVKCDAWWLSAEEKELDFETVAAGVGSYIDLVLGEEACFSELSGVMETVRAWAYRLKQIERESARVELVVRPAVWLGRSGFAVSLYMFGYGREAGGARAGWAAALASVAAIVTRGW